MVFWASLADEAKPVQAAVNVFFPKQLKDGHGAVEGLAVAADHVSQLAFFGAMLRAGNGGIKPTGALACRHAGHLAADGGADGAGIDHHRPGAQRLKNTVLAGHHCFHRGRVTYNHHDDAGIANGVGRRCGHTGARRLKGSGFSRCAIVDRQLVARFGEVQRHGLAHNSKSDESD